MSLGCFVSFHHLKVTPKCDTPNKTRGEDLQVGRAEQIKEQELSIAMHSTHAPRHMAESSDFLLAHHLPAPAPSPAPPRRTLPTHQLEGNTELRLLHQNKIKW